MPAVRVLSYNVRSLRDDLAALSHVVQHCRPDVMVVQEAPRYLRWRSRCAMLARECGLLYAAGGRTGGGNLLLLNHRVHTHGVVERRIPQRMREPIRGVVGATVSLGATRFGILGTHLGLSADGRRRQVGDVLAVARTFGDLPVILAGDLNERPGGRSWAAFAVAGFRDPADGENTPRTFPATGPRARIDAVLVSKGVRVEEHRVPDHPDVTDALRRASDHLPVFALLDVG